MTFVYPWLSFITVWNISKKSFEDKAFLYHNMWCIFCKKSSELSKTVEHIIQESLGNKGHVLPVGVVCDSCNWYFGAKVEKKLLEQPFFKHIRHRQDITSKRGKSVPWVAYSLFPVQNPEKYINSDLTQKELLRTMLSQGNLFYSPFIQKPMDENPIVSRFLAKVAIEVIANICVRNSLSLNEVIDNEGLIPLCKWARYGNGKFWPYHQRQIYDENKIWKDAEDPTFQVLHEYNIISFKPHEYYLVLAIVGFEFTINLGAHDLDSFIEWLRENQNISPLHFENFPSQYDLESKQ